MQNRIIVQIFIFVLVVTVIAGCEDPSLSIDEIFMLSASASSIPADGFSRVTITATIPDPNADYRHIIFTSSAGKLIGQETPPKPIPADSNGQAIVQLQSSQKVETALVQASVLKNPKDIDSTLVTRQIEVDFVPVNPSDIIVVSASASEAPADGATITKIFADINPGLLGVSPGDRRVTFDASRGKIISTNPVPADSNNRATVDLRSDANIGTAVITATVNDFFGETRVEFVRALPSAVLVKIRDNDFTVRASFSDSVIVDVELKRGIGDVTPRTVVEFSATDKNGNTFGFFNPSTEMSGSDGKIKDIKFTPGDTSYRGRATITAVVEGTTISGKATIEVVNP